MSRLTPSSFDYCPADVPARPTGEDRDELLAPAPTYVHRPMSREHLLRAINNDLVPCGAQVNPKEAA